MTLPVPTFSFIHKTGCDCSSDDGGTYADRLSRTRHAEAALATSVGGDAVGWEEAVRRYPDGCCLAWAAGEQGGWPGDRRDYHLIQLYRGALALRGTGAAAWAAVEAYRSERRTRGDFDAYDHAHPNSAGCAPCEEDDRLCAASRDAAQTEQHAQNVLAAALALASHGAQPDGSFVTRQSTHIASGRYVHTLHAPGRGGPLVEAQDAEGWTDYLAGVVHLKAFRTTAEARAIREEERRAARQGQERYDVLLVAAATMLAERYRLPYRPGQKWGTVAVRDGHVSALGALRVACKLSGLHDPKHAEQLLETWTRAGLDDGSAAGLTLGIDGIDRAETPAGEPAGDRW